MNGEWTRRTSLVAAFWIVFAVVAFFALLTLLPPIADFTSLPSEQATP